MRVFLQGINGFLIGVANIIPGVSGGTFALVLGIFDRLVESLNAINLGTAKAAIGLVTGGFGRKARSRALLEWRRIDGGFLALLGLGALTAIETCSFLFDYLLSTHPGETLAFFIGLIIPSLAVPYRMMEKRGPAQLFWILPGAVLTVGVSLADIDTGGGETALWVILLGGAVAVSAMILPGISGSFCLLVLGLYQPTLQHLKALVHDPSLAVFRFLGALALGAAAGLILFTRIMNFFLTRFRSATLAFLIGLILGSFWVLWPLKHYEMGASEQFREKIQVATAPNRLPGSEEGDLVLCGRLAAAALAGLISALGVNYLGARNRAQKEER